MIISVNIDNELLINEIQNTFNVLYKHNDELKNEFINNPYTKILAFIENKDLGKFVFVNTHLDFLKKRVQAKQLNKLKKIISKIEYPIILCGDFNLDTNDLIFKDFIDYLDSIGIKRISIDKPTYKEIDGKNIIDYIFVSKKFECKSFEVVKTNNDFSDHNLLLVDIK